MEYGNNLPFTLQTVAATMPLSIPAMLTTFPFLVELWVEHFPFFFDYGKSIEEESLLSYTTVSSFLKWSFLWGHQQCIVYIDSKGDNWPVQAIHNRRRHTHRPRPILITHTPMGSHFPKVAKKGDWAYVCRRGDPQEEDWLKGSMILPQEQLNSLSKGHLKRLSKSQNLLRQSNQGELPWLSLS